MSNKGDPVQDNRIGVRGDPTPDSEYGDRGYRPESDEGPLQKKSQEEIDLTCPICKFDGPFHEHGYDEKKRWKYECRSCGTLISVPRGYNIR